MAALNTVLHLSPHPDDELIGAPATLMALRDTGWRVVNLACALGRPRDRERRRGELLDACGRVGFEVRFTTRPIAISWDDDRVAAQTELTEEIAEAIAEESPSLVVSPHPHDRHHGHEVVARAARDALAQDRDATPRWWMWGLWGDLSLPTLGTELDDRRLSEILDALEAYVGELDRSDYRRLVTARARLNAARGPELLFGFGSGGSGPEYLELLTEVVRTDERWHLGAARLLDPAEPFAVPSETDVAEWLYAPSVTARFGPPEGRAAGGSAPARG